MTSLKSTVSATSTLSKGGAHQKPGLLLLFSCCLPLPVACSLLVTRPVQEMSDTAAAIRAAKEVQADIQAPDTYRLATESFFEAKKEYRFKNFISAREYAKKARQYAERAELDSVLAGAERVQQTIPDPFANGTERLPHSNSHPQGPSTVDEKAEPPKEPQPQGTPAEEYEKRRAEELAAQKQQQQEQQQASQNQSVPQTPGTQPQGGSTPTFIPYNAGIKTGLK